MTVDTRSQRYGPVMGNCYCEKTAPLHSALLHAAPHSTHCAAELQTVFIAMLVALLGPSLALRGPDGSLHEAVKGMQQWNSVRLGWDREVSGCNGGTRYA